MKLKSILAAALFAAITAVSVSVQAASDADKAAEAKVPPAGTQADKAVKPEEKAGGPQKSPDAKAGKPKPGKDKSKHYHPRDGK